MKNASILLLPGDGIGPEAIAELSRVMEWFSNHRDIAFDVTTDDLGGAAYDRYGTPLADATLETAKKSTLLLWVRSVVRSGMTLSATCDQKLAY